MTDTDTPTRPTLPEAQVELILNRRPFSHAQLIGYVTKGGTYVLASGSLATDDGRPRDLIAILPGDLGHGRVIPLYIGTNPDLVAALERRLAEART